MVDRQLLLRGVWQFHSDERREFMGAVDDWLRENTLPYTPQLDHTIQTQKVLLKRVLVLGNVVFGLLHQANAPVCLWPDAAEHANEVYIQSQETTSAWTE